MIVNLTFIIMALMFLLTGCNSGPYEAKIKNMNFYVANRRGEVVNRAFIVYNREDGRYIKLEGDERMVYNDA